MNDARPLRVAIADDALLLREGIAKVLEGGGLDVVASVGTGDELLKAFAALLSGCVRSTDTVARLGGDEFTIILESVDSPDAACAVAEKIIAALRTPMRPGDAIVAVSTSIGIAWADSQPVGGPALVDRADAALYRAKAKGKNTYQFTGESPALRAYAV